MCLGRWGLSLTNATIFITQMGFCVNYAIFTANAVLTFFPTYNCTVQLVNISAVVTSPDCQLLGDAPWQPWAERLKNGSGTRDDSPQALVHLEGISEPPNAVSGHGSEAASKLHLGNMSGPDWRLSSSSQMSQGKAYVTAMPATSGPATENSSAGLSNSGRTVLSVPILTNTVSIVPNEDQKTLSGILTSAPPANIPDSVRKSAPTTSILHNLLLTLTNEAPPNQTSHSAASPPASTNQSSPSTATPPASTNQSSHSTAPPHASTNQVATSTPTPPAPTNQIATSTPTPSTSTNQSPPAPPASSDEGSQNSSASSAPQRPTWSQVWAEADLRVMFSFPVTVFLLLVLPKRLRGLGIISATGNLGLLIGTTIVLASLTARKFNLGLLIGTTVVLASLTARKCNLRLLIGTSHPGLSYCT